LQVLTKQLGGFWPKHMPKRPCFLALKESLSGFDPEGGYFCLGPKQGEHLRDSLDFDPTYPAFSQLSSGFRTKLSLQGWAAWSGWIQHPCASH